MTYWLYQWIWGSLDWLFPPVCGGCNRDGFRWGPDCQKQVQIVPEPVCRNCGLPLSRPGLCPSCKASPPPYEMMRSCLVFAGPIRNALQKLKYRRNAALGDALAKHLAEYVGRSGWPVNLVVPVPLGKERKKEHGHNQVGLVAMPLASITQWRYAPGGVVRKRDTRSQVGLTIAERRENVSGAFLRNVALVSGATAPLVEEVAPAGSTLTSGAASLMDAGTRSNWGLTLACTLPHHSMKIV